MVAGEKEFQCNMGMDRFCWWRGKIANAMVIGVVMHKSLLEVLMLWICWKVEGKGVPRKWGMGGWGWWMGKIIKVMGMTDCQRE